MIAVHAPRIQCRDCTLWHPKHQITGNEVNGFLCVYCRAKRPEQMIVLSQEISATLQREVYRKCQECPTLQLPGVRFYLHSKDGTMQFLCGTCSDRYYARANVQYRNTLFGRMRKL